MKHRTKFSEKQRKIRSEISKIVHEQNYVRGSLVTMTRVCGNPNCRCAKGQKHVSMYLSQSEGGRTKKLFVPKKYEARVEQWIENYRQIKRLMEKVSDDLWTAVKERRFG